MGPTSQQLSKRKAILSVKRVTVEVSLLGDDVENREGPVALSASNHFVNINRAAPEGCKHGMMNRALVYRPVSGQRFAVFTEKLLINGRRGRIHAQPINQAVAEINNRNQPRVGLYINSELVSMCIYTDHAKRAQNTRLKLPAGETVYVLSVHQDIVARLKHNATALTPSLKDIVILLLGRTQRIQRNASAPVYGRQPILALRRTNLVGGKVKLLPFLDRVTRLEAETKLVQGHAKGCVYNGMTRV